MTIAAKEPRLVRKRCSKAARKGTTGQASPAKPSDDESADCGYITGKFIDGVEYMEMINWADYEDSYFAKVKASQKQWLLDKVLNDYRHVDLKTLARELACQPTEAPD